jgi:hypothetical protein
MPSGIHVRTLEEAIAIVENGNANQKVGGYENALSTGSDFHAVPMANPYCRLGGRFRDPEPPRVRLNPMRGTLRTLTELP